MVAFIDPLDGSSYIIKITEDVSKNSLTDAAYRREAKNLMLQANPKNNVIAEADTTYHGLKAYAIVLLLHTEKWGLLKQVAIIYRDEIKFLSAQISYPVKENEPATWIPQKLKALDKKIVIRLKQ